MAKFPSRKSKMSFGFGYKFSKAWHAVWQKYKLEVQLKIAGKLFLIFIVVWVVSSILIILSQWIFIYKMKDTLFDFKYIEYFWTVIIELVSGFDIPGEDLHLVSKVLSVIIVITGVAIFAIFTGQVVSMFVHVMQRTHYLPEKPDNFKFKRPIIIYGINERLIRIIEELKNSNLSRGREIIIVDQEADKIKVEDKKKFKDVWSVKGNQADRNVIESVLGERESAAIILSQESICKNNNKYSDSRVIETALAIEGYSEKTHTVLELNHERHIPHLEHTKINEWISVWDYGIKLVSQAVLQHGMAKVYSYLLGDASIGEKAARIYFTQSPLPGKMVGMTYEDINNKILTNTDIDITMIGFAKYVDKETNDKLKLELRNSSYIKQLNPVRRNCIICGCETFKVDMLGRVHRKCARCFEKEKMSNKNAGNSFYFPKDTIIKKDDQLIFLANKEIDFNQSIDHGLTWPQDNG
jgi:hypothetical protein